MKHTACYHLPGLFEFYELYRLFLPLFREHREYFYDWCEIGSIYGAPPDCIWGGGRVEAGEHSPAEVLALTQEYGISARLTFSNSLLRPEHLSDRKCNAVCQQFAQRGTVQNGVIVHSELLLNYLQQHYPELYLVSSTTKVLTDLQAFQAEVRRPEFRYVVPDFRLNKAFDVLNALSQPEKDKVEFLCNECCWFGCTERRRCYEAVSRKNLGEVCEHRCTAPGAQEGYRFSKAMENPGFIGTADIRERYLPLGFSNFKLEGRGLGAGAGVSALLSDPAGVSDPRPGGDLSGQHAGPLLRVAPPAQCGIISITEHPQAALCSVQSKSGGDRYGIHSAYCTAVFLQKF